MDRGREPLMVLQSLVAFYRDLLIAKTAHGRRDLVAITPPIWAEMVSFAKALPMPWLLASQQHLRMSEVQVKNTTQPRLWLEITLMGLLPSAQPAAQPSAQGQTITVPAPASPVVVPKPGSLSPAPAVSPPMKPPETELPVVPSPVADPVSTSSSQASPPVPTVKADPVSAPPPLQPSPLSQPSSPVPTGEMDAPAMGSLSDIWAKIVAQLTPMGTQVLMRQHGQLMACDGVEARVGITNDKLMRMAQDRLANVETAFEKVFGHKIRVTMMVAAANQSATPAVSPSARPASADDPEVKTPPADVPKNVSPSAPQTATAVKPTLSAPPIANAPPAESPTKPVGYQADGDLERSVKSFAQFFNGQIVNLDDEPLETASSKGQPSSEPGPDVPF